MFELLKEMNWSLLGTLIIASAIVAWAGDIIGMKLGRKRITFLKLRPKYTSRIISVLTGVGIAIVTLFVVSAASEPVRTALFSMNYVQNQITNLTAELQKNRSDLQGMEVELFESKGDLQEKQDELMRVEQKLSRATKSLEEARLQLVEMKAVKEKTEKEQRELQMEKSRLQSESKKLEESVKLLKEESEQLKAGIQRLREGRIAALTGEILAQGVISANVITEQQIDQIIDRLADEGRTLLAYRFGKKTEDIESLQVDNESIEKVKKTLTRSPGRWLVRLTALTNAVEGEPVMAETEVFNTKLIFKAKEVLSEKRFESGMPREQVEELVFRALRDVNVHAAREGVLRNPLTGNVGSMDTAEFIDAIEKITESKTGIKLYIIAAEDIYTEGPVRVKLILKNN
ncbi:MAG: DUF3084 domain-containing protein [Synergistaceae bacterium]|nr:DUF3084 domain-containing protein [Synergistaceae bacterium]